MKYSAKTDIGKVRKENQDAWRAYESSKENDLALVVCDGMGGANAGQIASALAAESFITHISSCLSQTKRSAPDEILRDAAAYANIRIFDRAFLDPACNGMGTTLVAVLVLGCAAAIVNVGDSRAYLLDKDGELSRITNDHSLVAEMVRKGKITKEQAKKHPKRNIITRALGMDADVQSDVFLISPDNGARLLLCTDGLTNQVSETEIAEIMKNNPDVDACCTALMELALERGAPDNVTAAVLNFE